MPSSPSCDRARSMGRKRDKHRGVERSLPRCLARKCAFARIASNIAGRTQRNLWTTACLDADATARRWPLSATSPATAAATPLNMLAKHSRHSRSLLTARPLHAQEGALREQSCPRQVIIISTKAPATGAASGAVAPVTQALPAAALSPSWWVTYNRSSCDERRRKHREHCTTRSL
jgi:hypothetical protein